MALYSDEQLFALAAQAKLELDKIEAARKHIIPMMQYVFPYYKPDLVHYYIAAKLEEALEHARHKEPANYIFNVPPQVGKSFLAGVGFCAFALGIDHDLPIIYTSYGQSLAESKSKAVRDLVKDSPEYRKVFPEAVISPSASGIEYWEMNKPYRGFFRPGSVESGITGYGALIGIMDDPHKNWKEAQSPAQRDNVWNWYTGTFRTRVWEGGIKIVIMTRWHDDDLTARLLNESVENWELVRIPALCESQEVRDFNNDKLNLPAGLPDLLDRKEGESCAPSRFSSGFYELAKAEDELVFEAEYQGAPTIASGSMFTDEQFQNIYIDEVPLDIANSFRIRYWDKAGTDSTDKNARKAKFTVGVLVCWNKKTREFYIEDVIRVQYNALKREELIRDTCIADDEKYRGKIETWIEREPADAGKEQAEITVFNLAGYPIFVDRAQTKKEIRWHTSLAQYQAGKVKIKKAEWNKSFQAEHMAAPNGFYSDQLDAEAGSISKLRLKGRDRTNFANASNGDLRKKFVQSPQAISIEALRELFGNVFSK